MDRATIDVVIVLALVVVVFFGFIRERLKPDILALCAVGILLVTGVLGIDDVLGALSNPALATVGAMFVLSAALDRTGVIDGIGRLMIRSADASPALALLSILLGVIMLSVSGRANV